MKTFKDTEGRLWDVRVDTNAVRNVRSILDVNLLSLPDDKFELLGRLTTDPVLLVDVLYVVCKGQAETREVSDEDFGRAMAGDALLHAIEALVGEIVDFFPDARRRAMLAKVIAKGRQLGNLVIDRAEIEAKKLDELDLDSEATKLIDSFKDAPESPESIPAP